MINTPGTDLGMYRTATMLEAMVGMAPAPQFFRDKLFASEITTPGDLVAIDYLYAGQRLAPFVSRLSKGVHVPRRRFTTQFWSPPFLKPVRPLTSDDMFFRTMGTSAWEAVEPATAKEAEMLAFDMTDLDARISRTEEWMCAQLLFTGSITAVDGDSGLPVAEIDYGSLSQTIPAKTWDDPASYPLSDLKQAIRVVASACGFQPDLIVMGRDAGSFFEDNPNVKDAYSRFYLQPGVLDPRYSEEAREWGVTILGTWRQLPLYISESVYEAVDGSINYYMPPNVVLVAATGLQNKMAYAGVSQAFEDASGMGLFEGSRIPQVYVDPGSDTRYFRLASRPVPVPHTLDSWTVLTVCPLQSGYSLPGEKVPVDATDDATPASAPTQPGDA
jgi:hypothetical protein